MQAEEFVRRLSLVSGQNDTHYAFWIGAGCSISSGIPGAAALVNDRWLPQLRQVRSAVDADPVQWAKETFPEYDPENPASVYGAVMEELFIQPEARQREVEALCEGRFPGFGYAVLAALLGREDGLFNVALTTNFDDLIADAMYLFTEARPLVIPDESLASFIRPTRMRPLVIKVHGDHRLSPRNTQTETATLKQGISEGIGDLLHDRGVIFVGYGGNDQGIAELLNGLPAQALPLGVWWVSREEPEGALRTWLGQRSAIWVEAPGFDELMLLFQSEFDIAHPSSKKFDRLFASYLDTYRELEERVGRIPDTDPQASSLKDATARADAAATDWSAVLLQAARIDESEPESAEALYRKGIEDFPTAILLRVAYGQLLLLNGHFEAALAVAEEAIAIDGENEQLLRLLSQALANCGRLEEGLKVASERLDLIPQNVGAHVDYGIFLAMTGDLTAAEAQLEAALERHPSSSNEVALVALLLDELGKYERATEFHLRGIAEAPDNANRHANYTRCLIALEKTDQALAEVEKALDLASAKMLPTQLETSFYLLAVGSDKQRRKALARLEKLIADGARSPAWNLDPVLAFARSAGVPDSDWLESLAAVIRDKEDPEILNAWPKWEEAQG